VNKELGLILFSLEVGETLNGQTPEHFN